jgi:hypothetical protein
MVDLYDFGSEFSQEYKQTCSCGNKIEVSTQKDNDPEYYSEIFVKCKCGKSVRFDLPVN